MWVSARTIAQVIFLATFVAWVSIGQLYYKQTIDSRNQSSQKETHDIIDSDKADERIARYNLWLAIFTGALVLVSSIQIRFLIRAEKITGISAEAARKAADAAAQANRPWVHIKSVKFTEPFGIVPDGATSAIEVITENVGRSAAVRLTISAQLIPMPLIEQDIPTIQTNFLNDALIWANGLPASAIFPNQILKHDEISVDTVRERWQSALLKIDGQPDRVRLKLGVCACYRLSVTGDVKYSYRIFEVGFVPVGGEEVPVDTLNKWLGASEWDDAT
jgi:hypothetical protein